MSVPVLFLSEDYKATKWDYLQAFAPGGSRYLAELSGILETLMQEKWGCASRSAMPWHPFIEVVEGGGRAEDGSVCDRFIVWGIENGDRKRLLNWFEFAMKDPREANLVAFIHKYVLKLGEEVDPNKVYAELLAKRAVSDKKNRSDVVEKALDKHQRAERLRTSHGTNTKTVREVRDEHGIAGTSVSMPASLKPKE